MDPDVYTDAARIQAAGAEKAAEQQQRMYTEARADLAPWRTGGAKAVNQIGGLLGLPGYTAQDPTEVLRATPGYEWTLGQGVSALDRSAAAKGMNLSGAQQKGLVDYGQNLGLKYAWNPYMSSLQALSGQGSGAAGTTGNWAMQTGQIMGQDYMAAANAQAQAMVQRAQTEAAQSGGFFSDVITGLGMLSDLGTRPIKDIFGGGGSGGGSLISSLGGVIAAPFTGGTSLIGTAAGLGSSLIGSSNAYTGSALGFSAPKLYAEGGRPTPGLPAMVGERGPELFVPDQPGYIVPNYALRNTVMNTNNGYSAFAPWRRAAWG